MKKRWIVAVVAVLLVLAAYLLSRPEPPEVELLKVTTGRVEQTVSNTRAGTVEACRRSKLSLPIGGQIAALHVGEGDLVEADQLLMALWNDDRLAQVKQAKAQVRASDRERNSICIAAASDSREAKRLSTLLKQKLVSG